MWWPNMRRSVTVAGVSILCFLYFPIIVLIVYSFSAERNLSFPITGFTFGWYVKLAYNEELLRSIRNSLMVAGAVVSLTLVLGVPAAYGLARSRHRSMQFVEKLLQLPLMMPGLITGLSILLLFKRIGFELSLFAVVLGHTVAWLPIVVTQVYARLRRFDETLEEASYDLGAGQLRTFFLITLPNLRKAIIGSALLVFTLSFDEVAITFLLTGTENTLPMHIWAMLRQGVSPEISAIATLTVALSTVMVVVSVGLLGDKGDGSGPER